MRVNQSGVHYPSIGIMCSFTTVHLSLRKNFGKLVCPVRLRIDNELTDDCAQPTETNILLLWHTPTRPQSERGVNPRCLVPFLEKSGLTDTATSCMKIVIPTCEWEILDLPDRTRETSV